MKKKIISGITAAAIVFSIAAATISHARGGYHHSPEKRVEMMAEHLELTESQKEQVLQVMQHHQQERKAQMEQRKDFRQQMMSLNPQAEGYQEQLKSLRIEAEKHAGKKVLQMAEHQQDIAEILTESQYQELQQFMEKKMSRMDRWHDKHDRKGRYCNSDKD